MFVSLFLAYAHFTYLPILPAIFSDSKNLHSVSLTYIAILPVKPTFISDAIPSIFPWTIDRLTMDTSDIEEPLSSIVHENDLSSNIQGSETENLEAIKKFIEEQEKEILEMELKEKKNQENKSETDKIQKEKTKEEIIQDNGMQESTTQEEKEIEENAALKENIKSKEKEAEQDTTKIIGIREKADTNHGEIVSSSVMNMILSESEANIAQVDEGSSEDIPKQETKDTPSETSGQKMLSPIDKGKLKKNEGGFHILQSLYR